MLVMVIVVGIIVGQETVRPGKGLKWYKKFGIDDEGFVFLVPFFIAYLLVLPGTLYNIYKLNEEIKYYNEHYNDYFEESDVEEKK